jgi:two-component system, NarL family, sensor kinase
MSHFKGLNMRPVFLIFCLPIIVAAQSDSVSIYTKQAEQYRFISADTISLIAKKLRQFGDRSSNRKAHARSYIIEGVSLDERGLYDSALKQYDVAFSIAVAIPDSSEIGRVHHHRGIVYKEKGQYDLAIDYLTKAARLNDDPYVKSLTFTMMASVFNLTNNFSSARRYALMAISVNPTDDFSDGAAYVELGITYFHAQKLDSAAFAFEKAKQFVQPETPRDMLYTIWNDLGVIYYFQGKLDEAIKNFKLTYDAALTANDRKSVALALMNIGDTYTAKGDLALAERYLNESVVILKSIKHKQMLSNAYEYLMNVQIQKNDWKQAFNFQKLNQLYKDSILNENSANKIAEIQTKYETEKKEQAIKTLEAEAVARQRMIVGIIIASGLGLVSLLLFFNRRTLKLKAQMAEEKERIQKERFRLVMDGEEKERKRVARELHDGLGQMLSTARLMVSDMDDTNTEPKVVRTLNVLDTTIAEVRNLSHAMMPIQLIKSGLEAALKEISNNVNASGKMVMKLTLEQLPDLSETVSLALYRCIQEVLNNSIKYSQATQFNLSILQQSTNLIITATDNGKGFDTARISESKGIGWSNVYSRIELIGGQVKIYSRQGEGTTVKLEVPLDLSINLSQQAG